MATVDLPQPLSPTIPSFSPLSDGEVDTVHRPQAAIFGSKGHGQVSDGEQDGSTGVRRDVDF